MPLALQYTAKYKSTTKMNPSNIVLGTHDSRMTSEKGRSKTEADNLQRLKLKTTEMFRIT